MREEKAALLAQLGEHAWQEAARSMKLLDLRDSPSVWQAPRAVSSCPPYGVAYAILC